VRVCTPIRPKRPPISSFLTYIVSAIFVFEVFKVWSLGDYQDLNQWPSSSLILKPHLRRVSTSFLNLFFAFSTSLFFLSSRPFLILCSDSWVVTFLFSWQFSGSPSEWSFSFSTGKSLKVQLRLLARCLFMVFPFFL